jgi:hypothetical protein
MDGTERAEWVLPQCFAAKTVLPHSQGPAAGSSADWKEVLGDRAKARAVDGAPELSLQEWDESNSLENSIRLLEWSLEEPGHTLRENKVPYNALHDKGYPSIWLRPMHSRCRTGSGYPRRTLVVGRHNGERMRSPRPVNFMIVENQKQVTEAVLNELQRIQDPDNEKSSQPLFDICTTSRAK